MILKSPKIKIMGPSEVAKVLHSILKAEDPVDQDKEHFWSIGINSANVVEYIELVSLGTLNESLVHPRETFRLAILKGVSAIIVGHNHPSGNIAPSQGDIRITERLKKAGEIIGIQVLDHVIINNQGEFHSIEVE